MKILLNYLFYKKNHNRCCLAIAAENPSVHSSLLKEQSESFFLNVDETAKYRIDGGGLQ